MKAKRSTVMIADGFETEPGDKGRTVYFKDGEEVGTYREHVEEVVALGLERIDTIFNVLTEMYEDPDGLQVQGLAYVGKELIEGLSLKVKQHMKLVNDYYGEVVIESAAYRQHRVEGGLPLAVVFTPKAGE